MRTFLFICNTEVIDSRRSCKKFNFWNLLEKAGDKIWLKNGIVHRGKDRPAIEYHNYNTKVWYQNGKKHRAKNKPAAIISGFVFHYYFKGIEYEIKEEFEVREIYKISFGFPKRIHSICNKPSVVYKNGTKEWHCDGKLHRRRKPAIQYVNGDQEWWFFGERHRTNGPAVVLGNKKYWFKKGRFIKLEIKNI